MRAPVPMCLGENRFSRPRGFCPIADGNNLSGKLLVGIRAEILHAGQGSFRLD